MAIKQQDIIALLDLLEQVGKLWSNEIISDEEFLEKKTDILNRISLTINPDYIAERERLAAEQERKALEQALEEQQAEKERTEAEQAKKEAEAYNVFWEAHAEERKALISKREDAVEKLSQLGTAAKAERKTLEQFINAVDFELNKSRLEEVDNSIEETEIVSLADTVPAEPVATEKTSQTVSSKGQKRKVSHERLIAIACSLALIAALLVFGGSGLNKYEKLALEDCKILRNMLKDPSSLDIYNIYVHPSEEGSNYDTLVYIDYSAANSYGGRVRDVAIFEEKTYLGGANDDRDDFSSQHEYDYYLLAYFPYDFQMTYNGGISPDNEDFAKVSTGKIIKALK